MLSTFSARRLARALAERDLVALSQIPGVGRKTAERLALELSEKVRDLALVPEGTPEPSPAVEGAVSALVALGFSFSAADAAVREAMREDGDLSTDELIRKALSGE
jgi:Holliday junction DNA helicase RuvA